MDGGVLTQERGHDLSDSGFVILHEKTEEVFAVLGAEGQWRRLDRREFNETNIWAVNVIVGRDGGVAKIDDENHNG